MNKSNLIQSKVSMCIENENGEEVDIEKKEDCIISSGILEWIWCLMCVFCVLGIEIELVDWVLGM